VGVPLPLLVGAIVAIGAVVALAITLGGGDDGVPSRTPSPSSGDPLRRVCRDLVDVQLLREDALGRAAQALQQDAGALRSQGDTANADAVVDIVAAIRAYQEVAQGGGDTVAATNQLLDALARVQC
jgi:hypothetical protein